MTDKHTPRTDEEAVGMVLRGKDAEIAELRAEVSRLRAVNAELVKALERAEKERDAIAELNQAQFLEIEYLRPIGVAATQLLSESEEYDFDDGMGKGALQEYWDELSAALEANEDAILAREGEKHAK